MLYEALYNLATRFFRLKPITLALFITEKCNARCIMCNIWKDGISHGRELTLEEYKELFSQKFFSNIRAVVLSGGEALLRPDIVDVTETMIRSFPHLKKITIATNGIATGMIAKKGKEIAEVIRASKKRIDLFMQVSYDGFGEVHSEIRGIKDTNKKVNETLDELIKLRVEYPFLKISSICVIQPSNLKDIDAVFDFLSERDISSIFTIVVHDDYYYKNDPNVTTPLQEDFLDETKALLDRLIIKERNYGKKFLYTEWKNMLDGKTGKRECPSLRDIVSIEPNGNVIPCLYNCGASLGNVTKDDMSDLWSKENTLVQIAKIKKDMCPTCLLSCGISHLEAFIFTIINFPRFIFRSK